MDALTLLRQYANEQPQRNVKKPPAVGGKKKSTGGKAAKAFDAAQAPPYTFADNPPFVNLVDATAEDKRDDHVIELLLEKLEQLRRSRNSIHLANALADRAAASAVNDDIPWTDTNDPNVMQQLSTSSGDQTVVQLSFPDQPGRNGRQTFMEEYSIEEVPGEEVAIALNMKDDTADEPLREEDPLMPEGLT